MEPSYTVEWGKLISKLAWWTDLWKLLWNVHVCNWHCSETQCDMRPILLEVSPSVFHTLIITHHRNVSAPWFGYTRLNLCRCDLNSANYRIQSALCCVQYISSAEAKWDGLELFHMCMLMQVEGDDQAGRKLESIHTTWKCLQFSVCFHFVCIYHVHFSFKTIVMVFFTTVFMIITSPLYNFPLFIDLFFVYYKRRNLSKYVHKWLL
jgi:hypothetical protein